MAEKTLLLVDGSYYLFRAYFGTTRQGQPGLANSRNEPTGAIFGVINMLTKLVADQRPDYLAVVFDAKGKSFRNEIFPEYKATRPPAPEDLVSQIQPIHDIIRAQGIPLLVIDGVEADDVIATLAVQAKSHGMHTLISSGTWDHPTVTGQFRIWITFQSQTMDGSLLGYDYYLENVPYVLYFYNDYALHGTFWHNNFGTPMSHGCVNMKTSDAEWVYYWAPVGTLVNVHH